MKIKWGLTLFAFLQIIVSFGETKTDHLPFLKLIHSTIGAGTKAGTSIPEKQVIKIEAYGADIWGKRDEFSFDYKKVRGDFDFSVQVEALSAANAYTKAGIMARTDLSDSSQHVFFQVFPDNRSRNKNNGGCEFQYRLDNGSDMKAIYPDPKTAGNQFNVTFPNTWIRLKRSGDIFVSYISNDNKIWRQYTTFNMKMPLNLYVGLAVTSHNPAVNTTAVFRNAN